MSKLAILFEWTLSSLKIVFAHLSLILLLEIVELALVAVKAVII